MIASQVARARVAEPIHPVGAPAAPTSSPRPGSSWRRSAHVYPDIVHGQAILGVAERVADGWKRATGVPTAASSGMT